MFARFFITLLIVVLQHNSIAQNDSILYSFFVAGHASGKPGVDNVGLHPKFKAQFPYIKSRTEIELGILTGDVIRAFPGPTVQDWIEVDADIDSLGIPVHITVGNHDMEDRPLFEQRYGKTYYSFKKQNDLFIILDPMLDGWKITGDQLNFLKDTLQANANQCDNIFVFFHQVIWKEVNNGFNHILWNSNEGKNGKTNFWTELFPIFSNLDNPVFLFAGDVGAASYATPVSYDLYDNLTLITSGMGNIDNENYIIVNVDTNKNISYNLRCLQDTNLNCLGELEDHLVVNVLVGNNNTIENNLISISPNPAKDVLNIKFNSANPSSCFIYDINGRLIKTAYLNANSNNKISTYNLKNGLYFLNIKNEQLNKTVRFVKE